MIGQEEAGKKNIKCPGCKKPAPVKDNPYKPFCSERCKMTDLGGWFTEQYKISEDDGEVPGES